MSSYCRERESSRTLSVLLLVKWAEPQCPPQTGLLIFGLFKIGGMGQNLSVKEREKKRERKREKGERIRVLDSTVQE